MAEEMSGTVPDVTLRAFSISHLYYELWMVQETARRLLHDDTVHHDRVVKNAMVESFCVHARSVAAFLYPERFARRGDDVNAEKYIADAAQWLRERGAMPDILVLVKDRTGKEIAHLTTERKEYDDPDKEWPLVQIVEALHATLKVFMRHAAQNRVNDSLIRYIAGLQPPMDQPRVNIYEVGSTGIITASEVSFPTGTSRGSVPTDVRTRGLPGTRSVE